MLSRLKRMRVQPLAIGPSEIRYSAVGFWGQMPQSSRRIELNSEVIETCTHFNKQQSWLSQRVRTTDAAEKESHIEEY